MTKQEIIKEYQEAQRETFNYKMPNDLVDFCKGVLKRLTVEQLKVGFQYYLQLLERDYDWNLADTSILLNHFYDFGWEYFEEQGHTFASARRLAEEQQKAVMAWETQIAPARLRFNKKLEIIEGGRGGGSNNRPNIIQPN